MFEALKYFIVPLRSICRVELSAVQIESFEITNYLKQLRPLKLSLTSFELQTYKATHLYKSLLVLIYRPLWM